MANAYLALVSPVADAGVAHFLDTAVAYTSGTLQSWRANESEKASVDFEGSFTGKNVKISATDKLYLDGGVETYIAESSADVMSFTIGGTTMLALTEAVEDTVVFTADRFNISGNGPHAIGAGVSGVVRLALNGAFTSDGSSSILLGTQFGGALTGASGDTSLLVGQYFGNSIVTQTATESIGVIAQSYFIEPAITDALTGDITIAATVYIAGAPDEGEANAALYVADGAVDFKSTLAVTSNVFIGDSANANMTTGLTINQAGADNQILCFKSSDVSHGLTTATIQQDVEVDDFYTMHKVNGPTGGISIQIVNEHSVGFALVEEAFCGSPDTSDATNSGAACAYFVAEHNGSNGLVDMAANSNGYLWGEITSGGTRTVRMILKADDGELHLGNTTLVALDDEDDISLVRAMQYESSGGVGMKPKPWTTEDYGVPTFSHEKLMEIGVLGEKDADGNCLMRVQPRFAMNEGAIWQNHVRHMELVNCLRSLVEANPNLEGRDTALTLLEVN